MNTIRMKSLHQVKFVIFATDIYILSETQMLRNHYFSFLNASASKYCGSVLKNDFVVVVVVVVGVTNEL